MTLSDLASLVIHICQRYQTEIEVNGWRAVPDVMRPQVVDIPNLVVGVNFFGETGFHGFALAEYETMPEVVVGKIIMSSLARLIANVGTRVAIVCGGRVLFYARPRTPTGEMLFEPHPRPVRVAEVMDLSGAPGVQVRVEARWCLELPREQAEILAARAVPFWRPEAPSDAA